MQKTLILVIILAFICSGCGPSVKTDLTNYVNFEKGTWEELGNTQNDFFEELNSHIHNKQHKTEILKKKLKKFTAAVEQQKQYKPQTKEVQNIHNKLLKILDISEEAFDDMLQAEEHNNFTQEKADELLDKYHEVEVLAQEYRHNIQVLQEKSL